MNDIVLTLQNLQKRFQSVVAVNDVSLQVRRGEFISLLGPSGCGKTTTLRMIAGYIMPDGGQIFLENEDLTRRPPYRRDIGMVFQSYALFPHMTIKENVAFGLRMRHVSKVEADRRVEEVLALVRLEGYDRRRPSELSGGQQQRVALARAIVIRPRLLLLDEPLSNLDARLRKDMQIEIRSLQESLGITTIHVTHDQSEALSLSDRIVVMAEGKVQQIGAPTEIYQRPNNAFVADFIGEANVFKGIILDNVDGTSVRLSTGEIIRTNRLPVGGQPEVGHSVTLIIRPEQIRVSPLADGTALSGVIRRTIYTGSISTSLVILNSGLEVRAENYDAAIPESIRAPGQKVSVTFPIEAVMLVKD